VEPAWEPAAAEAGIRASVAFPVRTGNAVVGALEFFLKWPPVLDDLFLRNISKVGVMLGRVFERRLLERTLARVTAREQQRIGRELHDGIGQQLTAAGLLLAGLRHRLGDHGPEVIDIASRLTGLIDQAKSDIRKLSHALALSEITPDKLVAALESLVEVARVPGDVDCRMEYASTVDIEDEFTATQLYRIAQEALNNSIKHAEPGIVLLALRRGEDGSSILEIRDDGSGFSEEMLKGPGIGLRIMRHRAQLIEAELEITSAEDGGTIVRCTVPAS
jgi:signal transduction histidine kinase